MKERAREAFCADVEKQSRNQMIIKSNSFHSIKLEINKAVLPLLGLRKMVPAFGGERRMEQGRERKLLKL